MKKIILVSITVLAALTLTACSSGGKASNSSSSSKVVSAATGMNAAALVKSNFSSIAGTWKNGDGEELVFNKSGLVALTRSGQVDTGTKVGGMEAEGSVIKATNSQKDGSPGAVGIVFVPKGVDVNKASSDKQIYKSQGADPSDVKKDRIFFTQNTPFINKDMLKGVYYRVSSSTSLPKSTASSASAPSSSSAKTTAPSSNAASTRSSFNLAQIKKGNFATLAGTWKNAKGSELVIQSNGNVQGGQKLIASSDGGGIQIVTPGEATGGAAFTPVPAGEAILTNAEDGSPVADPTDQTRDRLYITNGGLPANLLKQEIYYKISNATTFSQNSSTASQASGMNLQAIAKGDYSSVVGTWKSSNGGQFDISKGAISWNDGSGNDTTVKGLQLSSKIAGSVLLKENFNQTSQWVTAITGGLNMGAHLQGASVEIDYLPKGVIPTTGSFSEGGSSGDSTKDRIVAWYGQNGPGPVYYKVSN